MDIVRIKKNNATPRPAAPAHTPMVPPSVSLPENHTKKRLFSFFGHEAKSIRSKIIIIVLMIIFSFSIFGYWYWKNSVFIQTYSSGEYGFFDVLGQVFTGGSNTVIKGEKRGRTNFLLMGVANEGHDGATLSDSNVIVSINHDTKEMAIIHIPRDMAVKVPNLGYRKLNSVHAIGEATKKDSGPEFASQVISETFGIPIDYYLRINFDGVEQFINALDGVDVHVESDFTDYKYPTADNGIMTISFKAGEQHLDGEQFMQYVRSRHSADNNEGSDFSRGRRQTLALEAVKEKVKSLSLITDAGTISDLVSIATDTAITNMKVPEAMRLYHILKDIPQENMFTTRLDNGPDSLLADYTNNDGAYTLIPKDGGYEVIQKFIRDIFSADKISKENPTIVIRNGNGIPGEADYVSNKLRSNNLKVQRTGNADNYKYEKSIIFNLSKETKPETLKILEQSFPELEIQDEIPDTFNALGDSGSDFIILLGKDLKYQL